MKRFMVFVGFLLVFLPQEGFSQGFLPNMGTQSWLASLAGLDAFDVSAVRFEPHARVGFQSSSINFNVPSIWSENPGGSGWFSYPATLDVQLKDTHLWVGAVGCDTLLSRRFSVYLNVELKAQRSLAVTTNQDPLASYPLVTTPSGTPAKSPMTWTGAGFEWWGIDGGVKRRLGNDLSLIAGLKVEHLSMRLEDPRDSTGSPISWAQGKFTSKADSDLQANFWIPYIGLIFGGEYYRASMYYSPFSSAGIKIPIKWALFDEPIGLFNDLSFQYSSLNPVAYLEAFLESEHAINQGAFLRLWLQGRWLRIRGDADFAVTSTRPRNRTSNVGIATYTESSLAGGIAAVWSF
jgi:hypothetical protein